jgi:hypothetical protein
MPLSRIFIRLHLSKGLSEEVLTNAIATNPASGTIPSCGFPSLATDSGGESKQDDAC